MRGLLIIGTHLKFYSVDEELKNFALKRWCKQRGREESEENVRNALSDYFVPLAVLYSTMDLQSIKTENGSKTVFKKIEQTLFIAFSGDDCDTEQILVKRICMLFRVLKFLFGPVVERVFPENLHLRQEVWQKLRSIIDCYLELGEEDLTFQLEAIERISFRSQLGSSDLKKACIQAIEAAFATKNVSHALLLVRNKIAVMKEHKTRPLTPIDQLLIMLFSRYYLGSVTVDIKASPQTTPTHLDTPTPLTTPILGTLHSTPLKREYAPEEVEETNGTTNAHQQLEDPTNGQTDEPEEPAVVSITPIRSIIENPTTGAPLSNVEEEGLVKETFDESHVDLPADIESDFENETTTEAPEVSQDTAASISTPKKGFLSLFGMSKMGLHGTPPISEALEEADFNLEEDEEFLGVIKHHKEVVFLRKDVPYGPGVTAVNIPYMLHFVMPAEGVVLAFTEELPGSTLAASIGLALRLLRDCAVLPTSRQMGWARKSHMDLIDQNIKSINEYMAKISSMGAYIKDILTNISRNWNIFKERKEDNDRTRSLLDNLEQLLVNLFERVYFMNKMQSQFTDERLVRMVLKANRSLKHYSDMLTIRGLENIPLASCTEYSKDLLFYIIVDRRRNRVLMPSIVAHGSTGIDYLDKVASQKGMDGGLHLKKQVRYFVTRVHKSVMKGFTCQMWVDDSFHYSYYLLVYNPGNEDEPIKVADVKSEMDVPPGELTGDFFRRLRDNYRLPIFFFEVFCMFPSTTPSSKAVSESKKLVDKFVSSLSNNPFAYVV